ncbi:MAG: hypothetical protein P1S46_12450, partial [bacterium]|nr:hypothetical protein [bacterium]
DGNGVVDIYASDDSAVSYTYQYAGIYNAVVTVVDASAQEYTSHRTVVMEDISQLGPVLTGRWDDVSVSLTARDVQGAMVYFLPESRDRYTGFLEAIKHQLPAVHQSLPTPVFVKARGDTAEYLVTREQVLDGVSRPIAYSIFFQRDLDGIWRIREY